MRKHASGFQIGVWIVSGLAGLYLLGAAWVFHFAETIFGPAWAMNLPDLVTQFVFFIYWPIYWLSP